MEGLEKLAGKLKKELEIESKYEIVDEEEDIVFGGSQILNNEFYKAKKVKNLLLREYEGADVKKTTGCNIISNDFGEVLHRKENVKTAFKCPEKNEEHILSDLKLVYGIGPVTEKNLKSLGYRTIRDLKNHEYWGDEASAFLNNLDNSKLNDVMAKIIRWKSASHPLALRLSGHYETEDFAILDIETMGLTNQPVILIGLALPGKDNIKIHQFLLKDVDQEVAALMEFINKIDTRRALLTFNGKTFDIPYVKRRLSFYGIQKGFNHNHFDLYHFSKRAWKGKAPNYCLNTLEREILGLNRPVDIPSVMVPEFYQTYREKGNPGPLIPILEHNRQDLLSLSDLFRKLRGELLNE